MKFLKHTMAELTAVHETLEWLAEQGIQLGIPSKNVTITNSRQKVDKVVRDWRKAELQAGDLGYSSLAIALKALSQIKGRQEDLSHLPEVFHSVPDIWLRGKVDSSPRKADGFKPMSVTSAVRQHKKIQSLLIEAWQLAESREEESVHDSIVKEYLSVSSEEFEKALYRYIYDLEPVTVEEELQRVITESTEEREQILKYMLDPNRIYGVVPKEQKEEEE